MLSAAVEVEAPVQDLPVAPLWTLAERIAFRFVFCYFVLFFLTNVVDRIPFTGVFLRPYSALWTPIVVWVDQHVLHTGYEIYPIGGRASVNNTPYGLILFLCYAALAAAATLLWSLLDRRRTQYERLHQGLRFLLRLGLAITLINYGIIKAIPSQMTAPPPLGLLTPRIAELTHMRMLWIFMGSSPVYETFTGLAELLGGLLLLVPRTTLLGALLCCGDMFMVFMLNMCYDVHVKIYSLHLLLMAILLVAPDLRRLADLLLFNRRVEPARTPPPLFERRWLNRVSQILLVVLAAYTAVTTADSSYQRYQRFHPPHSPLYGIWSVEKFVVDGKELPLFTDPQRWRWVTFQGLRGAMVELMIGREEYYHFDLNLQNRSLKLGRVDTEGNPVPDPGGQAVFSLRQPEEDALVLDGTLGGHPAHAELRRAPLTGKRFHWVFVVPKGEE